MNIYQYVNSTKQVVKIIDEDGISRSSCLASVLEPGTEILPADLPHPNIAIDAQIAALEGKTERGVREALLYMLAATAAAQGISEPQLYAANYGYRKAKDLEAQIAMLRAQRI